MTKPIHPLQHVGSSQIGRLVQALRPDFFRLDERSIQDLITASYQYAAHLRYGDAPTGTTKAQNWQPFWEAETLTYLAVVAATDLEEMRRMYEAADQKLTRKLEEEVVPGSKLPKALDMANYGALLEEVRKVARSLEKTYQKLVALDHPLQYLVAARIAQIGQVDYEELQTTLRSLIGWHKGAIRLEMARYQRFFSADGRWGLKNQKDFDAIPADLHFNQEKIRGLFVALMEVWQVVKSAAQASFDEELARLDLPEDQAYRLVQPHIVLFIVFLRLFRYAQESLNELGNRHLDYFYEEVLGLERHPAVPDDTYLLFELAKGVDELLLAKGILFVGGKDKNGRPLLYETLEDWILRAAKVADLKTTYLTPGGMVRANANVQAKYDQGAVLPNEKAATWRAMGDDNHLPAAELGFAIASPQLILREGRRVVDVVMTVDALPGNKADLFKGAYFDLYLSSEKEWIKLQHAETLPFTGVVPTFTKGGWFNISTGDSTLQFRLVLERDDLPVTALGPELAPEAGFTTHWPMLKVLVKSERLVESGADTPAPVKIYEALRTITLQDIEIAVDVKDIRENLIIQSDLGVFDGTQKVFPFGPAPEVGNRFYVGSTEVFQKALETLKVEFDWIDAPANFKTYYDEYDKTGRGLTSGQGIPTVQIDFIDRADASVPKQIVKAGARAAEVTTISGRVTNLDGMGIEGVTVTSESSSVTTNGEGRYSALSAGTNIAFSAPKDTAGVAIYEDLAKEGNIDIGIGTAAEINVILFPASRVYGEPATADPSTVKDIFGKALLNTTVDKTNTNLDLTGLDADKYKPIPDNIPVNKFSNIQVYVEPKQEVKAGSSALNANRKVSGTIKEAGTQGKSNDSPVAGAQIIAIGTTQTVTAISNTGGKYALTVPTGAASIDFYPAVYGDKYTPASQVVKGIKPSTGDFKQTIDAFLLEKAQVEQEFTNDDKIPVKITFLDYKNVPITSDFPNVNGSTINGIYSIDKDADLLITKSGTYEDVKINIGNYNDLTVKMYPKGYYKETGRIGNDSLLAINVYDLDGGNVLEFIVKDSTGNNIALSNGKYNVASATSVTIAKTGFEEKMITFEGTKPATLDVILKPEKAADAGTIENALTATIKDAKGGDATGLTLTVEEKLDDSYIKFETSNKTIDGLKDVKITKLTISDGEGYVYEEPFTGTSKPNATINRVFTKQIKRTRKPAATTKIIVQNFEGAEIEGAVLNGDNNKKTDSKGEISTSITNGSKSVNFTHPLYQDVTFEAELGCTQLTIRMIPKPVHFVIEGKVTDMFKVPIPNPVVQLYNGTTELPIKGTTQNNGQYSITIPSDAVLLKIKAQPFKDLDISLASTELVPTGRTRSIVDAVLYYDKFNTEKLLTGDITTGPLQIQEEFTIKINALNLVRDIRTQQFEKYSPTLKRGFLRFTLLEGNFLHKEYPKVLTLYALDAARAPNSTEIIKGNPEQGKPPAIPNPPYTPATNGIKLSYSSKQSVLKDNQHIDQYYHLLPFNGHRAVDMGDTEPAFAPVYPYNAPTTENQEKTTAADLYARGNLYIGLSELTPGGTLSLLFTVRAGTERNPEQLPPPLYWSILVADNQWEPIARDAILADETHGLTRSGLVRLAISTRAVTGSTLLDARYFWLRVAVVEDETHSAAGLPSLVSVKAQGVRVRFHNDQNDLSHLAKPLPAGTISKLAISQSAIKKIEQPLPSFDGRLPETEGLAFYQRISERLRHRERAVTVWDYEHLLLERFPQLALAKCIPHTRYKVGASETASEWAPGFVTVAVIPQVTRDRDEEWWEPRFAQADLDEMRAYLAARTNPDVAYIEYDANHVPQAATAHLQVVNALFEQLDVTVGVQFRLGEDVAYRTLQLQKDIAYFLSPWVTDPAQPPVFGKVLYKSDILQFIEAQSYVDFVDVDTTDDGTGDHRPPGGLTVTMKALDMRGAPIEEEGKAKILTIEEAIYPTTARSVLLTGKITVGPPTPKNTVKDTTRSGSQARSASIAPITEPIEEPIQTPVASPKNQRAATKPKTTKKKKGE